MGGDSLILLVNSFEAIFDLIDNVIAPILIAWWWVIPPLFLFRYVPKFWLLWRQSLEIKKRKYVMLEIKLPTEILKPVRAMEDVMSALFLVVVDPDPTGNIREKWIDGDNTLYPHLSFEIASFGGQTKFFIRVNAPYRDVVESAIYAQYPEVQIEETEDYTDFVPQDIPNKGWDLENREWVLGKPSPYPIKTYMKFETEHESKEEKRVDSMARMLEALSTIKEGEQIWFQIIVTLPKDDLAKEGGKIRDGLVFRPDKSPKPQPMIIQAINLFSGAPEKKEEEKQLLPPEMKLTPGEREVVKEIEAKIAKSGFETTVRIFYLAKREVWFKPHLGLPIAFLTSHNTRDLNAFKVFKPTTSKIKTPFKILDKRRQFLRKRRAFRNYKMRVNPLFPNLGGTSVLNAEELATLFHFPSRVMAPASFVERIEHKRGEAPSGLPIE